MEKKYVLKQIGKNIQKIRMGKGYTQETFSELMGVSWSYVAKIESGILNLSLGKITEFANYLNVDINEILEIKSQN
ncbi:helix-turn-helix transcriptional regulator [bacterium]|nr:helix-turn-helix transcriptional regulator [bacterium]